MNLKSICTVQLNCPTVTTSYPSIRSGYVHVTWSHLFGYLYFYDNIDKNADNYLHQIIPKFYPLPAIIYFHVLLGACVAHIRHCCLAPTMLRHGFLCTCETANKVRVSLRLGFSLPARNRCLQSFEPSVLRVRANLNMCLVVFHLFISTSIV